MEALYAARRPARHGNVEEYMIVPEQYMFGRSLDTDARPIRIRGYYFNDNKRTIQSTMEKLNLEKSVKKPVVLPDDKLEKVLALAKRYPQHTLIHEQEYAELVDDLFGQHSIMSGLFPDNLSR